MNGQPHLTEFVDLLIALLSQPAHRPEQAIHLKDVANLHRLALTLTEPIAPRQAHHVMDVVEAQLRQLQVGTTWYLLSGEGFARWLTETTAWPFSIAPAIVSSVGKAYHQEHRPDIALSLSKYFNYEPTLWLHLAAAARRLKLEPSAVNSTCHLV